jgi:hypothetical protein
MFKPWSRVARWYVFKPKILIRVNFGGPWNEKSCYIIWPYGIFYDYLIYFMDIFIFYGHLVIKWQSGIFSPF